MVLKAQTKFLGGKRGGTVTANFPGYFQHLRDQRRGEKHSPTCPQHPRCPASSGSGASLQLVYCCWFIASFKATTQHHPIRLPDPNRSLRGAGRALMWCPDASQPWGTGAVGAGVGPRREQQAFFLLVDHLLTP